MTKRLDPVLGALIATLEDRARAHGGKSIVKGVVKRLTLGGADDALIADVAALRPKKVRVSGGEGAETPKIAKPATDPGAAKGRSSKKDRAIEPNPVELVDPA